MTTDPALGVLAIIAGSGSLPKLIAGDCAARGRKFLVVNLDFVELDWLDGVSVIEASVERIGGLFAALKAAEVSSIVFAGGITRPRLDPDKFDEKFRAVAPVLLPAIQAGDDTTLSVIAGLFEDEGFNLVAAHDVVGDLLAGEGVLSRALPSEADKSDAGRAAEIAGSLGSVDVGQAAVVAQGICLGCESIQGTDVMLKFVAETAELFRPDAVGAKGVLFKGPKSGQDRRFDMPAVGAETLKLAAAAGLAGVVIEAGGVLLLDRDETVEIADKLGLFLWARSAPEAN